MNVIHDVFREGTQRICAEFVTLLGQIHQALAGLAEAEQWTGDAPVWHRHLEEQSWRTPGDLTQNSL